MTILATEQTLWGMRFVNEVFVYVPIGFGIVVAQIVLLARNIRKPRRDTQAVVLSLSLAFLLIAGSVLVAEIRNAAELLLERDGAELRPYLAVNALEGGPLLFVLIVSSVGPVCVVLNTMIQPARPDNAE